MRGSSLSDAVRANASPAFSATSRGLDVEVEEHLEVVGHETDGADHGGADPVAG